MPTNAELEHIKQQGAQFKALAEAGGFGVNEAMGNAYIGAINRMLDRIDQRIGTAGRSMANEPQLGHSYAAREVRKVAVEAATDPNGLVTRMTQVQQTLIDFRAAVEIAKRQYHNIEEEQARQMKRLGPQ
ncbi:hypothetical protein [Herbihabitans rhizosphaerae]|nr:hypothetical protein [Herbihabitans rhizosphaerae]